MKANEIFLRQFLSQSETKFLIPVYQRNYDWKQKQCAQLLKDIITNARTKELKPYFIGSIVYTSKSNLASLRELVIIDGQQRITTINLLLLAVAKIFKENSDETYREIWDYYLQNKFLDQNTKLKLKPVQKDERAYYSVIHGNTDQIEAGNRILENYNYYLENINTLSSAKEAYEGFKRLTIVEIGLDERDDAQKIFQSLNSTGLDLSQADLIRNYILMNLTPSDQERIYNEYWSQIENYTYSEKTYTSKLSEFFRDFLTHKYKKVPSFRMVFEEFKQRFVFENNDIEKLDKAMSEMKSFSKHYQKLLNQERENDTDIRRELRRIDQLEMTVAYPYLLGVFEDFTQSKINKDELLSILKLIQTFTFRRFICNLPTNSLNKIFSTLYDNSSRLKSKYPELSFYDCTATILVGYSSYQKFPTDAEVADSLKIKDIYKAQSKNKNYLLEMIENNYSDFNEMEINIEKSTQTPDSTITVEHIFPQNPSTEWKKFLSDEEFVEMKSLSNTLANLTIVINNSSLGNKTFIEKRDLNEPNSKGFKYSKFHLNETLSGLNEWNLTELNRRFEILLSKFLEIWKYPSIKEDFLKNKDTELEIDIFDLDDVTNKRPEYIVFGGTKINVNSYRDILKIVVNEFLKSEPETLFIQDIREKIGLTKNSENLRGPLRINQDYFIEGHIRGNHIIRNVVSLLENSEGLNEMIIKFQDNSLTSTTESENFADETIKKDKITKTRKKQLLFWTGFVNYVKGKDSELNLQKPRAHHWYDISVGSSDAHISLTVNSQEESISCGIYVRNNKELFNYLKGQSPTIEKEIESELEWIEARKATRIKLKIPAPGVLTESDINKYYDWLYTKTLIFKRVFKKYIDQYKQQNDQRL